MPDLDYLRSQKSYAEREYAACKERIRQCEEKLERLRPVKSALTDAKSAYGTLKKNERRSLEEKISWKGRTKQDFDDRAGDVVSENDGYHADTLDFALDSLNDEITRLENKVLEEGGTLGRLLSWINSLANEIENFLN